MLEQYAFFIVSLGALLGVLGFVWLVVRAFKQKALWGLGLVLFPPSGLVFIWRHFGKVVGPFSVLLFAGLLIAAPYAASYYERHFVPLKPYEQIVDGDLRITVTGLKNFDYASLRERPQTVVLQMANADVDDRTLENLKGMDHLAELDLNGTQITDQGLAIIATLPLLKKLRIARTKITDEGFRLHLYPKESLMSLDLTGTDVKGKTKRDWKKQKPEDREYVD
jgi:hypothetical protein